MVAGSSRERGWSRVRLPVVLEKKKLGDGQMVAGSSLERGGGRGFDSHCFFFSHRDPQEFLDGHRVAVLLRHHRHVVQPVKVRERLLVVFVLDQLFGAAVQEADVGVGARDALAVELEDEAEDAVRRRVLRPEVEREVLDREVLVVDHVALHLCELGRPALEGEGGGGGGAEEARRGDARAHPAAPAEEQHRGWGASARRGGSGGGGSPPWVEGGTEMGNWLKTQYCRNLGSYVSFIFS